MQKKHEQLRLAFGFTFEDLYSRDGLQRLDASFREQLEFSDTALLQRLMKARRDPSALTRKDHAELIIALAPQVEDFIGDLFGIGQTVLRLQARHSALEPLNSVKRRFVQKKAISGMTAEKAAAINGPALAADLES